MIDINKSHSRDDIIGIISSMNEDLNKSGFEINLVDGDDECKLMGLGKLYFSIGVVRRMLELKQYAQVDILLDKIQEEIENVDSKS
jgi:hypothetical protein